MPLSVSAESRSNVVAGSLVGAVVLVLGFGSGIGAVFSHHTSYAASGTARFTKPSAASGSTGDGSSGGAASSDAGLPSELASATSHVAFGSPASRSATVFTPHSTTNGASAMATQGSGSSAAMTQTTAAPPAGGACSNEMVVNAMTDPFVTHLYHGHLEESPGQQAGDATNVDQYVKTHTVLVETMAAPGIAAGQDSLEGAGPFFTHFDHGHLEESPAQQAADVLDVSQYVKTHTVLIENMTAPASEAITGTYGC